MKPKKIKFARILERESGGFTSNRARIRGRSFTSVMGWYSSYVRMSFCSFVTPSARSCIREYQSVSMINVLSKDFI